MQYVRIPEGTRYVLNRDVLFLYFHSVLASIGHGSASVFIPIFLYREYGFSLTLALYAFLMIYVLQALLIPVGARYMSKIGIKNSMIVGIPFLVLSLFSLIHLAEDPFLYSMIFIVCSVLYRMLFWVPYRVDLMLSEENSFDRRHIRVLKNALHVVQAVSPFLAGIVVASSGFSSLFTLLIGIYALSVFPLFFLGDHAVTCSYTYYATIKKLFDPEVRRSLVPYARDGFYSALEVVLWPIFIFMVLKGDSIGVGGVLASTMILMLFVRALGSNMMKSFEKSQRERIGMYLSTTGWFLRGFVGTGFQIVTVDAYHRVTHSLSRHSSDTVLSSLSDAKKHFVDEQTVIEDMAFTGGRVLFVAVCIVVTYFLPIWAVFVGCGILGILSLTRLSKSSKKAS